MESVTDRGLSPPSHLEMRNQMDKTIAFRGDPNYVALDLFASDLLRRKSYLRLARRASTSWTDPRVQPIDSSVKFKLAYFGPDRILFAVRTEFVADCGLTPEQIGCPESFTFHLRSVQYVGALVNNDDAGRQRIASVLSHFQ